MAIEMNEVVQKLSNNFKVTQEKASEVLKNKLEEAKKMYSGLSETELLKRAIHSTQMALRKNLVVSKEAILFEGVVFYDKVDDIQKRKFDKLVKQLSVNKDDSIRSGRAIEKDSRLFPVDFDRITKIYGVDGPNPNYQKPMKEFAPRRTLFGVAKQSEQSNGLKRFVLTMYDDKCDLWMNLKVPLYEVVTFRTGCGKDHVGLKVEPLKLNFVKGMSFDKTGKEVNVDELLNKFGGSWVQSINDLEKNFKPGNNFALLNADVIGFDTTSSGGWKFDLVNEDGDENTRVLTSYYNDLSYQPNFAEDSKVWFAVDFFINKQTESLSANIGGIYSPTSTRVERPKVQPVEMKQEQPVQGPVEEDW